MSVSNDEVTGQELSSRLDRIPKATRSHKIWITLLSLLYFSDQFDIAAYSYTAPAMLAEWHLKLADVALGSSTAFIGMFVGAIFGGRLADAFGRKKVIIYAVIGYSLVTACIALAQDMTTVAVLRGIAGLGLQALAGVVLVFISELFPRHLRGRYTTIMLTVAVVAVPLSGFIARLIVPLGEGMWRWLYVTSLTGLAVSIICMFALPESPRWLVQHGKLRAAEALIRRLENEAQASGFALAPLEASGTLATPGAQGGLKELFTKKYLSRTIVSAAALSFLVLVLYGFNSWLPTLMVQSGYTQADALTMGTLVTLFIAPGALLAYPIIDRFERKRVLLASCLVLGASLVAFSMTNVWVLMLIAGTLVTGVMQTCLAAMYTYIPEVYPTHLRGVGAGTTSGFGRLAGFFGAFIIAAVYGAFGYGAVFVYLAALCVIAGVILSLWGIKTTNRSLEDIS